MSESNDTRPADKEELTGLDYLRDEWPIHLIAVGLYAGLLIMTDLSALSSTAQGWIVLYWVAGMMLGSQLCVLAKRDVIG